MDGSDLIRYALYVGWSVAGLYLVVRIILLMIRMRKSVLLKVAGGIGVVAVASGATAVYAQTYTGEQEGQDPWASPSSEDPIKTTPLTTIPDREVPASIPSSTAIVPSPSTSTLPVQPDNIFPQNADVQKVTRENYIVAAGDNLWIIAQQHVRVGENVADLWQQMINENSSSLRSGNPNLIYPGEEIIISHETMN